MIEPNLVVEAARKYINTPYLDQGRKIGVGCDCIGLPIMVAQDLGLGDWDEDGYRSYQQDGEFKSKIEKVCANISIQPGALLLFKISSREQHCGIVSNHFLGGFGLIHAWDLPKQVCEHRLDRSWRVRAVGCYGFRGVNWEVQ
jgi:hypothetical protein